MSTQEKRSWTHCKDRSRVSIVQAKVLILGTYLWIAWGSFFCCLTGFFRCLGGLHRNFFTCNIRTSRNLAGHRGFYWVTVGARSKEFCHLRQFATANKCSLPCIRSLPSSSTAKEMQISLHVTAQSAGTTGGMKRDIAELCGNVENYLELPIVAFDVGFAGKFAPPLACEKRLDFPFNCAQ